MPAFLTLEFWSLANPELWVGVGLLLFVGVTVWAGAHRLAFKQLDARAVSIQTDLDEAARIRADAEAMLADLRVRRTEAEHQAADMIGEAAAEAKRMELEAHAKLEERIARRTALADRRIALAETQAAAEVRAAAADLATQAAEIVLAARLKGAVSDPMIDKAVGELGARLQ